MQVVGKAGGWTRRPVRRFSTWPHWRRLWLTALGLLAALWLLFRAAELYTEWLWFEQLGHSDVLTVRWLTQSLLFLGVGSLSLLAIWANVLVARRLAEGEQQTAAPADEKLWVFLARVSARLGEDAERGQRLQSGILAGGGLVALLFGLLAGGQWQAVLSLLAAAPFGVAEPYSGRDVGFYVFTLPVLRAAAGWLFWLVVAVALAVAASYLVLVAYRLRLTLRRTLQALGPRAWLHLAAVGAALLLTVALGYQVALLDLVYSTRGQAADVGFPGYTDLQVQAPAFWAASLAAALAAMLVLVAGWRRDWRLAAGSVAGLAALAVLGVAVPTLVQVLLVRPNELERERPYLSETIRLTRLAWGLDRLQELSPPAGGEPALVDEPTLGNVPLWTRSAVRDNLNQLQAFRPYYRFVDADVDRYEIGGRPRLVLLAARELNRDALPARSWLTSHLQFTHGSGLAMALAGGVVDEGRPQLVLHDLPTRGELPVERPEVYFGELTDGYVVVRTSEPEFDLPRGEENLTTRFEGRGVGIGSLLRRLAFALRFGDPNLLLTQSIRPESEVLFHRQVLDRVGRLAPFLVLDPDPYLVVADGRLFWIVDGYTTSEDYPLVQRRTLAAAELPPGAATEARANYARNSVKAVVDAYDGSARLFVADAHDPLIVAYGRVYPGLLEPLEAMPPALRAHLRYPRLLFAVQSEVLARFHVQDPTAFYQGEDVWRAAEEKFESRTETGPYYLLLRLPGEPREELLLVQPFSPFDRATERHNLVALLVARSDPPHTGELLLLRYPKDRLVTGPLQVERRIDQDPNIASQFSLWQRVGSAVLRSKLVALPLGATPLYVEAVYLQRGVRPVMPELKRVILATESRVVMEATPAEALARLRQADDAGRPGSQAALVRAIRERLTRVQDALFAGDRTRYADELAALEADLERLEELTSP